MPHCQFYIRQRNSLHDILFISIGSPRLEVMWSFAHYNNVIMSAMTSQITSFTSVYWTVDSGADQRKRQSSASLAFVRGIHRRPVNSPHKEPVTRKMFPFDEVIMWVWDACSENRELSWCKFCRHWQVAIKKTPGFYRDVYTCFLGSIKMASPSVFYLYIRIILGICVHSNARSQT